MRVILNGASTLKPKTGVGHTTVYLHRALQRHSADSFWLFPGQRITSVAQWLMRQKKADGGKLRLEAGVNTGDTPNPCGTGFQVQASQDPTGSTPSSGSHRLEADATQKQQEGDTTPNPGGTGFQPVQASQDPTGSTPSSGSHRLEAGATQEEQEGDTTTNPGSTCFQPVQASQDTTGSHRLEAGATQKQQEGDTTPNLGGTGFQPVQASQGTKGSTPSSRSQRLEAGATQKQQEGDTTPNPGGTGFQPVQASQGTKDSTPSSGSHRLEAGATQESPGQHSSTAISHGKPWFVEGAKAAYRAAFREAARWGRFDLYHEPNFVPIRTDLPTVVTVHDLSVLLHPEWHPADRVAFHERHFHKGIEAADHVIVVSEAVRQEMIAVLGFPPNRVTAIHNGIGDQYLTITPPLTEHISGGTGILAGTSKRSTGKNASAANYLLTVGTIEPRKNIGLAMRAYCDLPADARAACPLILAGSWGWKSEAEREFFESVGRHRGIVHLGYVPDAELPGLYAGAAALLYPSFYEGFGLPPVEMLACGGAVIASTAAAVREVVGRHALLLDPDDFAGWRDAMLRVIHQPGSLNEYRRGGIAHARTFTWDRAAELTLGVYRRVLNREAPVPSTPAIRERLAG